MPEKGYTRRQAARKAGVCLRTIDNYLRDGVIQGRMQEVDGHGWMRVFTESEVERIRDTNRRRRKKMPVSLHRHIYGTNPDGSTPDTPVAPVTPATEDTPHADDPDPRRPA